MTPLAAAALVVLAWAPMDKPGRADLVGEVVAAHVRSLQADHLTDVVSSDRHTVKPWFQGKVPFSLPVRDFAEEGFPLEGGRVDYVGGHVAAALVYRTRLHAINVIVWPAAPGVDTGLSAEARSGLHTLHWTSEGLEWWLVSDAGSGELERLADLLRRATP